MDGKRFIRTIRLENILSYGPDRTELELQPLNVLIGPNASGKSNLIEALSLLESAPGNLQRPIEMGGGIREWLWKGQDDLPIATIEVTVEHPNQLSDIRYKLSFSETNLGGFKLQDETIEGTRNKNKNGEPPFYYQYNEGKSVLYSKDISKKSKWKQRSLEIDLSFEQSILSQFRDPVVFPELDYLSDQFKSIWFYREWDLGHYKPPRIPLPIDFPVSYLFEDASNLSLVLSTLLKNPELKEKIINYMKIFYPNSTDIGFEVKSGGVLMHLHERGLRHRVPATRLSDGTLRFLCLLTILLHPDPPSIICIEEPEGGLHPDIIPEVGKLLVDASSRSQIIVTTHSDILVDALSDFPESIIVCEKPEISTQLQRLDREEIEKWLSAYRGKENQLGTMWTNGEIGGNRW